MAAPFDAESTIREQRIYRIDDDMSDEDSEAETRQHFVARVSPLATTASGQESPLAKEPLDRQLRRTLPMLPAPQR